MQMSGCHADVFRWLGRLPDERVESRRRRRRKRKTALHNATTFADWSEENYEPLFLFASCFLRFIGEIDGNLLAVVGLVFRFISVFK